MSSDRKETGGKFSETARRFRAVRMATSKDRETVAQWGQRMGIGQSGVSNFQTGVPVSKEAAKKIFVRTGIPMEYLLLGDRRHLTIEMSEKIKAARDLIDAKLEEPPASEGSHFSKRQDIHS